MQAEIRSDRRRLGTGHFPSGAAWSEARIAGFVIVSVPQQCAVEGIPGPDRQVDAITATACAESFHIAILIEIRLYTVVRRHRKGSRSTQHGEERRQFRNRSLLKVNVVVRNRWVHIFADWTSTLRWPCSFGLNECLGRHRRNESHGRTGSNIGVVDGETSSAVCTNGYSDSRRVSSGGRRCACRFGRCGFGWFARTARDEKQ
jgi:hypothetical protein